MGALEIALVAAGLGAVAVFTSISLYFAQKRSSRREPPAAVPELEALLQPHDVPLKVRVLGDTGRGGADTRIVVEGVCGRLTLRREPVPAAPDASGADAYGSLLRTPSELEIGDPEFDRAFFVLGPHTLLLALLDAETRRLLRHLALYQTSDIAVEHGQLVLDVQFNHRMHPSTVEERGRAAVALARRLLPPTDVARRLAENGQRDPIAEVRLRNLNAAVREDPDNPFTRAALRAATTDRHPEVRLRAALALGPEARDVLLALIEDHAAYDGHREAAIRGLGSEVPEDVLLRVLRRFVGGRLTDTPAQPGAARACVEALGQHRTPEAFSTLQALLVGNASLGADAARALGHVGGEEAEAALMGALDCDVFESRLAAAEVLGAMGTTAAVPALREAERHGVEIRRLARQAIAEIQARATEAPGAVSLAGAEAGQVSIAEDPAGRVSLPGGERARERP